jgi:hemolysin D
VNVDASRVLRACRAHAALACAAALAGFAIWAAVAELDVVAIGEGRVIPTARVQRVQAVESGRVIALHVDDGARVRRGDPLVELEDTLRRADRDRLAGEVAAIGVDVARLRALAGGDAALFVADPRAEPALLAAARAWLEAELGEHAAECAELDALRERLDAQSIVLEEGIRRLERVLPIVAERATARGRLAREGHYARLAWLEIEQQHIERQHELAQQRARRAELAAERAALVERRRRTGAGFVRQAQARLADAERAAAALAQELAKAEQHLGHQRLTAPLDGTVHQRSVHTLGGVVGPGETLMLVVPDDSGLEVEALVPGRDAGFIATGQRAVLKFDAFPFTLHGVLAGTVREIGRDAVEDPRLGLAYPVRVALDATRLQANGAPVALAPGMRATVDIVTERRRVAALLLSPLLRLRDEALRER